MKVPFHLIPVGKGFLASKSKITMLHYSNDHYLLLSVHLLILAPIFDAMEYVRGQEIYQDQMKEVHHTGTLSCPSHMCTEIHICQ